MINLHEYFKAKLSPFLVLFPVRVFGLVLVFAFSMKCFDQFLIERTAADPLFAVAAIVDLLIGCILIVSTSSLAFILGASVFGLYFAYQARAMIWQVADCDCLGNWVVAPSALMFFDLFACIYFVTLILLHRGRDVGGLLNMCQPIFLAAIVAGFVFSMKITSSKSVTIRQSKVLMAGKMEGSWRRIAFDLRNESDCVVRIVGMQDTCSSRAITKPKLIMQPGEERSVEFHVRGTSSKRFLRSSIPLFVEQFGIVRKSSIQYFVAVD